MKRTAHAWVTMVVFTAILAFPSISHACAVCFGDPNSLLVKGAKAGVLVLAVFIYGVLMTMAGIAYVWYRRAKALEAAELATQAE